MKQAAKRDLSNVWGLGLCVEEGKTSGEEDKERQPILPL